ncbi:sulfate reduction electron transfer complex DsrMKJOP subunit DsrJ [Desulfatiferula olefinivorans]
MNEKIKIVAGLVIFVLIATCPFWINAGKAKEVPKPVLSEKALAAGTCILPKDVMATNHMQLLDGWRNSVVRDGQFVHVVTDEATGTVKEYDMSLSNTCLACHTNKAEFCDSCHNYASVNPYCWDCHVDPNAKEASL